MTASSAVALAAPVATVAAEHARKRRPSLPLVAAAIVGVLAIVGGGGYFVWTSAQQAQLAAAANGRILAWDSAVATASSEPFVTVDSEDAITFRSARKKYCDPDDFMHYDGGWGETVNWDAVETCKLQAEVNFSDSAMAAVARIETFAAQVGIPASFSARLTAARGLDGTQQVEFEDTKAGPLRATFSYDGGNGVFLQIERLGSRAAA
jgi:hypothetical protein